MSSEGVSGIEALSDARSGHGGDREEIATPPAVALQTTPQTGVPCWSKRPTGLTERRLPGEGKRHRTKRGKSFVCVRLNWDRAVASRLKN